MLEAYIYGYIRTHVVYIYIYIYIYIIYMYVKCIHNQQFFFLILHNYIAHVKYVKDKIQTSCISLKVTLCVIIIKKAMNK